MFSAELCCTVWAHMSEASEHQHTRTLARTHARMHPGVVTPTECRSPKAQEAQMPWSRCCCLALYLHAFLLRCDIVKPVVYNRGIASL